MSTIEERLEEHKADCLKVIDLTYVKRRPVASVALFIAVLSISVGALAYYYSSEGMQDQRHSSIELKESVLSERVKKVECQADRIEQVILNNQNQIIEELRRMRPR